MQKYIIIIVACFCSSSTSYSIKPAQQIAFYHYTPPQGLRLELPQYKTLSTQGFYQQFQQFPQFQHYQQHPQHKQKQQQQQQQRSYQQKHSQQQIVPQTIVLTGQNYNSHSASLTDHSKSDSVRLPLPLGVASIKVGPLPLSKGVSYSDRPVVTSYGTPYPLRFR